MRIKDFSSTEELQAFVESMRLHSTLTRLRDVELLDGGGAHGDIPVAQVDGLTSANKRIRRSAQ
jgi:hypothetical protein